MSTKQAKPPHAWEQVLVRHIVETKRVDLQALESLINWPFAKGSMLYADDRHMIEMRLAFPGDWALSVRFQGMNWLALFANTATPAEIFASNATSRRLDVIHLGCEPNGRGWFFTMIRGGKMVVEFTQPIGQKLAPTFKLEDPSLVDGCQTTDDVFQRLCDHYEIKLPIDSARVVNQEFEAVAAAGNKKPARVAGYIAQSRGLRPTDDSPATLALLAAIDACDLKGIRRAVTDGASLTEFRSRNSTPFRYALYKCGRPGWQKCVELLAELGCPHERDADGTPTVLQCCRAFIDEPMTLAMLEVLLPLGVDVNAQDKDGHTALVVAAFSGKKEATKLLMEHGADSSIKDNEGRTVVSLITPLHKKALQYREREIYAEILCTLTEAEYKPPVVGRLEPKLAAEMERLRACNAANEVFHFAKWGRSVKEQKAAAKVFATPSIFIAGTPARFERVGFYLEVSEWDDPGETTANIADSLREYLENKKRGKNSRDAFDFSLKLSRALMLLGMRHLQFAGAPKDENFLDVGCDSAIAMFKILAAPTNRELRVDHIEDLAGGLLLAALVGRWKDFDKLCELAPVRLARKTPQDIDDLSTEHVNAILRFVSDFRKSKFPGLSKMEDAVLNGRPKRPKQLLKIWQAIGDNDPSAFRKALTTSITDFSKQERNPAFCTNARNALAVEESVMCLAAKRLGIDTPKLDESVSDYLVTTDSIRYCDHD